MKTMVWPSRYINKFPLDTSNYVTPARVAIVISDSGQMKMTELDMAKKRQSLQLVYNEERVY